MAIAIDSIIFILLVAGLVWFKLKRNQRPKGNRRVVRQAATPTAAVAAPEKTARTASTETAELESEQDADSILGLNRATPRAKKPEAPKPERPTGEVLVLHVMAAQDRNYRGYELLQALLSAGLRFGDMKIFHRHETKNGRGPVYFSLASVAKPGSFDMQKMGAFETPGLVMFMELTGKVDHTIAFDTMIDTAKQLVEDLGGEVSDERMQRLTMEKVTELRRKIRKFEESQHVADLFSE